MNYQRYRAAKPGGFPMKTVSVSSSAMNQYQVTMEPFECGNNFDLFKIAETQTVSLYGTHNSEILKVYTHLYYKISPIGGQARQSKYIQTRIQQTYT